LLASLQIGHGSIFLSTPPAYLRPTVFNFSVEVFAAVLHKALQERRIGALRDKFAMRAALFLPMAGKAAAKTHAVISV